jgi:hypothetical protein
MNVRVNKRWWQFWLPKYIDVQKPSYWPEDVERILNSSSLTTRVASMAPSIVDTAPYAIESDGQEPSWDNEPDEESSVITAEPPIVYASRGNAKVAQREES